VSEQQPEPEDVDFESALAGYRSMLRRAGERLAEESLEDAEPDPDPWE
jgi:hypothetical protein